MIKHYETIADIREDYLRNGKELGGGGSADWYGYESKAETIALSATGDTRLVSEAEAMIEKITTSIEVPKRVVQRTVAGGWPSVPDAIAGLPLSMRRMVETNDDRAPITIYADTSSSAGINAAVLKRRGCAILALVMELSKVRPVTLYQITTMGTGKGPGGGYGWADRSRNVNKSDYASPIYDNGEVILTARINTAPLDLATACYVLTSQGFSRRLTYDTTYGYGGNGEWPVRYNLFGAKLYAKYITETMGNPDTTLYIEAPHVKDTIVVNPVGWLETQIKRFTESVEEKEYA